MFPSFSWFRTNTFTTLLQVAFLSRRTPQYSPLLHKLHWLPITQRIKYKPGCLRLGVITGSASFYLSKLWQSLHIFSHTHVIRHMPLEVYGYKRIRHGFCVLAHYHGLCIWNDLPIDDRHCANFLFQSFKGRSKTNFFRLNWTEPNRLNALVLSTKSK